MTYETFLNISSQRPLRKTLENPFFSVRYTSRGHKLRFFKELGVAKGVG